MIPEAKQPAVTHALQAAFGVNEYEDIRLLSGGLSSALACKMVVKGKPYLLKILRKEMIGDPRHEFDCMQAGAEAGIAPHIWYANVEDRLLITDFVEAQPFPEDMLPLIVPTLRTLHALPRFPSPMVGNYLDAANGFARRFQAAKLLPDSATEEVFRRYAGLIKVYPRNDSDLVSSHNDLKPQNMRFDGKRLWLVDWEAAFLNDRYVDLAVVANFFVKDEAQEDEYLAAYFGEPAGEYRRARFYLMRQVLSMFYATLLLMEASRAGLSIDADMQVPDFREYHQDLISGKIDMLTAEAKWQYGMLHLREALRNMRTARFEEALATVDGQGSLF
jgi:fructose-specific component phosphotransferase system IIB-like protein